MNLEQVFESYKENIMPTYTKVPLVFVKGKGSKLWDIKGKEYLDFFPGWGVGNKGSKLWDIKGKEYLDFFPGWGVGNLGHCHPKVMDAVRDQISKLIFIPNNYHHVPQAKLAKEIVYWTYPAKVFFCNSGAEANEGAIKFARKFGKGRYEIITFEDSFHGRTLATLAATGQKKYQEGFAPLPEGFKTVKFNDLEAVKKALTDKTVAIMLELIQGEGGINIASKDFVHGIKKICEEKNLLLIVDEVQTGMGRTGRLFCYQHYGITPDIMTLAKALGGGLPIGMMVVKKEIADTLQPGMHASTFGGGPVICKAALASLTAIQKEKLLAKAQKTGEYLLEKLHKLRDRYPAINEVRGMGLMIGLDLNIPGKPLVEKCFEKGLLINCTHDTVIRLMPALNISIKEVDRAIDIIEKSLIEVLK
ncbi:MAG: aspartate aminotransferase family protein [Candidatus Omnitrophica bacterium]|nr:aspartate aminotransferase family protein [Candidatus Omnitrophota bacterium]